MPWTKEQKALYPRNWKKLSLWVRFERAGGRCEFTLGNKRCPARHGQLHPVTGARVVLTTAHLDHDPTNNDPSNLRAGCQLCHNRHDVSHRVESRKATRRRKKNTLELFPS
jgi:hypothetical protein